MPDVEMPDGSVVTFPETMGAEDINKAIATDPSFARFRHTPTPTPTQPGLSMSQAQPRSQTGFDPGVVDPDLVRQAYKIPYVYGGTDPKTGMDCSAFTRLLFRQQGVPIPDTVRTAQDQWSSGLGQQIKDQRWADLQPGDHLFFQGTNNRAAGTASHTGFYLGQDAQGRRLFVHESSSQGGVMVSNVDTYTGKRLGILRYSQIAQRNKPVTNVQSSSPDVQSQLPTFGQLTARMGPAIAAQAKPMEDDSITGWLGRNYAQYGGGAMTGSTQRYANPLPADWGKQQPGVVGAIKNLAYGAMEPENMALLLTLGPAEDVGGLMISQLAKSVGKQVAEKTARRMVGRAIAGGFAASMAPDIKNRLQKGDVSGALTMTTAAIAPTAVHEALGVNARRAADAADVTNTLDAQRAAAEAGGVDVPPGTVAQPATMPTEGATMPGGAADMPPTTTMEGGGQNTVQIESSAALPRSGEAEGGQPQGMGAGHEAAAGGIQGAAGEGQAQAETGEAGAPKPEQAPQVTPDDLVRAAGYGEDGVALMRHYTNYHGDNANVPDVLRIAQAITNEEKSRNPKAKPSVAHLAEAMQYEDEAGLRHVEETGRNWHDERSIENANDQDKQSLRDLATSAPLQDRARNVLRYLEPVQKSPESIQVAPDMSTKPGESIQVKRPDEFYAWRRSPEGTSGYEKVTGKPVTIPGAEGYDLFSYKDGKTWHIVEGKSGLALKPGGYDTLRDAIAGTKELFDTLSRERIDKAINDGVGRQGLSPRYANAPKEQSGAVAPLQSEAEDGTPPPPSAPASDLNPIKEPEALTGTKNAITETERAARNLTPVERQAYTTIGKAYETGRDAVESGDIDPRGLAQAVVDTKGRTLNAQEVGALGYDRARLINEHNGLIARAEKETDPARLADIKARMGQVEAAYDLNDQALVKGGREQSAAFNARKMQIAADYSPVAVKGRMKAANPEKPLTPQEETRVSTLTSRLSEVEKQLTAQQERIKELEAQRQVRRMAREDAQGQRRQQRARTIEDIRKQRTEIEKSIAQKLGRAQAGLPADVIPDVAKLAKTYVAEGVTRAEDLVDAVHAQLAPMIDGLTKRDVRDAISGYGETAQMSKDQATAALREARRQMRLVSAIEDAERRQQPAKSGLQREPESAEVKALRAQLDTAMRRAGLREERTGMTEAQKLQSYKTRVQGQIEELEGKIQRGDFTKPEPRPSLPLDAEAEKLRQQRDLLKQQIDTEIAKREPRGWLDKAVALHREFILSGPSVFEKLFGATVWGMPSETLADVFGGVAGKVTGLDKVAGREGTFSPKAETAGYRALVSRDAVRNAVETIKTGANALDAQAGVKAHGNELGGYVGRIHGAEKSFFQTAQYEKAVEIRTARAAARGMDIADPEVQEQLAQASAVDAINQKFQGKNALTDALNNALGGFQRNPNKGVQVLGAFFRTLVPITRVSANILGRTVQMTGAGLVEGAGRHLAALRESARTGEPIPPEVADTILRAYKYGGVGLVTAYIGLTQPQWFKSAGYFAPKEPGNPDTEGKPMKPGDLQIFGHAVPKVLAHAPFVEAVQFWASVRRGYENAGVPKAAFEGGLGLAEQAPGVESVTQMLKSLEGENQAAKWTGTYLRGLTEPQALQQYAAWRDQGIDPYTGQPVKRSPADFTDELKMGVPGLRQQVPANHSLRPALTTRTERALRAYGINLGLRKPADGEEPESFRARMGAEADALNEAVSEIVTDREWRTQGFAQKKAVLQRVVREISARTRGHNIPTEAAK